MTSSFLAEPRRKNTRSIALKSDRATGRDVEQQWT
jgi:hypothetical protein